MVPDLVGLTSDRLICSNLRIDVFFKIVGASDHTHMAIIEYVPDGGVPKVRYEHWDSFTERR